MRRVLVTGGTRGIGYAIATSFKKAGYKVCVAYIGGPTEAQKIEKDDISAIEWGVSNFEVCKANISKVEEKLGGNIEILINNAGITRDGMLHKQSRENWDLLLMLISHQCLICLVWL